MLDQTPASGWPKLAEPNSVLHCGPLPHSATEHWRFVDLHHRPLQCILLPILFSSRLQHHSTCGPDFDWTRSPECILLLFGISLLLQGWMPISPAQTTPTSRQPEAASKTTIKIKSRDEEYRSATRLHEGAAWSETSKAATSIKGLRDETIAVTNSLLSDGVVVLSPKAFEISRTKTNEAALLAKLPTLHRHLLNFYIRARYQVFTSDPVLKSIYQNQLCSIRSRTEDTDERYISFDTQSKPSPPYGITQCTSGHNKASHSSRFLAHGKEYSGGRTPKRPRLQNTGAGGDDEPEGNDGGSGGHNQERQPSLQATIQNIPCTLWLKDQTNLPRARQPCPELFLTWGESIQHAKTEHYWCGVCHENLSKALKDCVFHNMKDQKAHTHREHVKAAVCIEPGCGKRFGTKAGFKRHVDTHRQWEEQMWAETLRAVQRENPLQHELYLAVEACATRSDMQHVFFRIRRGDGEVSTVQNAPTVNNPGPIVINTHASGTVYFDEESDDHLEVHTEFLQDAESNIGYNLAGNSNQYLPPYDKFEGEAVDSPASSISSWEQELLGLDSTVFGPSTNLGEDFSQRRILNPGVDSSMSLPLFMQTSAHAVSEYAVHQTYEKFEPLRQQDRTRNTNFNTGSVKPTEPATSQVSPSRPVHQPQAGSHLWNGNSTRLEYSSRTNTSGSLLHLDVQNQSAKAQTEHSWQGENLNTTPTLENHEDMTALRYSRDEMTMLYHKVRPRLSTEELESFLSEVDPTFTQDLLGHSDSINNRHSQNPPPSAYAETASTPPPMETDSGDSGYYSTPGDGQHARNDRCPPQRQGCSFIPLIL